MKKNISILLLLLVFSTFALADEGSDLPGAGKSCTPGAPGCPIPLAADPEPTPKDEDSILETVREFLADLFG